MAQNPFAGAVWFVDRFSNAQQQVEAWQNSRPQDATSMRKIARNAQADWFGDWSGDIHSAVDNRVTLIDSMSALPVLVAYNIPNRDCSGQSGGGASTPAAYRQWIKKFAEGIDDRKAVVILEPDALAHAGPNQPCAALVQGRCDLLSDAINLLKANSNTFVYVDAGNAQWVPAGAMTNLLKKAGVAQADGFALNVSNFVPNNLSLIYGTAISQNLNHKPFVVDTSRNGHGPQTPGDWCNPTNKGLGLAPTAATNEPRCHAFFWVKRPGESDGFCNGGPQAGSWWADYALGLCQRAAF